MIKLPAVFQEDCPQHIKQLAAALQLDFIKPEKTNPFYLAYSDQKLVLHQQGKKPQTPVLVDFLSSRSEYRRKFGGSTKEAVVKAVGKTKGRTIRVVDATAGLGRDAFVLASNGAQVHMFERHPMVFLLLADGLKRAGDDPKIGQWVQERLTLGFADSAQAYLPFAPDVVYLDPMFAPKRKSALVKKEMRVFQDLVGFDQDEGKLLSWALNLRPQKVVVKRARTAPCLANQSPQQELKTPKHRFDIYLQP